MSLTKSGHNSIIYTHSHYHSLSLSYFSSNESIPGATGNRKWTFLFGPYSPVIKDSLNGKPSNLCWPWAKLSPTNHPCYLAGAVGSQQTACRAPRRVWFPLWPCITLQTTNPVSGPAVDRRVCCFQMSLLCLTWHHFKPCRPLCLSMLYLSLCWRPRHRTVALKSVNPAHMLQLTVCAHLLHLAMKNIRLTAWKRLSITSQKLHVFSCYGIQPFLVWLQQQQNRCTTRPI